MDYLRHPKPYRVVGAAYTADDRVDVWRVDLWLLSLPHAGLVPRWLANSRFYEWRKVQGFDAGSMTRTLDEDGVWRYLLALPAGTADPTSGRAVVVERLVQRNVTLDEWHAIQGAMIAGSQPQARRCFDHFGAWRRAVRTR